MEKGENAGNVFLQEQLYKKKEKKWKGLVHDNKWSGEETWTSDEMCADAMVHVNTQLNNFLFIL